MAEQTITRRLAAILAADMVGYSRLMEADEAGTIARQKAHRAELIDPKIAVHQGRIFKTTGDGLLVEFASAVDAVRCAVELQQAMAEREGAVAGDRRIRYRIGINLGDIVLDGQDILGDGVNIAARLEALAEPDGIAISGHVHEQVLGKIDTQFRAAGARQVNNIARPIHVWCWPGEDLDLASAGPAESLAAHHRRENRSGRSPAVPNRPRNQIHPGSVPGGVDELSPSGAPGLHSATPFELPVR